MRSSIFQIHNFKLHNLDDCAHNECRYHGWLLFGQTIGAASIDLGMPAILLNNETLYHRAFRPRGEETQCCIYDRMCGVCELNDTTQQPSIMRRVTVGRSGRSVARYFATQPSIHVVSNMTAPHMDTSICIRQHPEYIWGYVARALSMEIFKIEGLRRFRTYSRIHVDDACRF